MILVACVLLYLAIVKQFEPLLLLPIAFGMLLANLPAAGMMSHPQYTFYGTLQEAVVAAERLGRDLSEVVWRFNEGDRHDAVQPADRQTAACSTTSITASSWGIFPPIIFMGVGAMTDFAPLIANPKSLLLGAAAQLGIFLTFIGAKALGFQRGRGRLHRHHRRRGTARRPSSSPRSWRRTCWARSPWRRYSLHGAGAGHPAADHEAADDEEGSAPSAWA